jgi:Putative peptidoglycan binding domain
MIDDIEPQGLIYSVLKHARKIFILGIMLIGFGWIYTNALFMQSGHHPAPLFVPPVNKVAPSDQTLIPTPPLPAPRPQAKLAEPERADITHPTIKAAPSQIAAPAVEQSPPPPKQTKDTAHPISKDPIADLINNQGDDNVERIKATQRALIKLGYVLRDNGILGSATQQAIEIYEKQNNLPITGTLTLRLLQDISRQSGISIP